MADSRVEKLARILVEYSAHIRKGDRVLIELEPVAEPLIRALYKNILQAGGHPHLELNLGGQISKSGVDTVFFEYASDEQLDYMPPLIKHVYDNFESRIRSACPAQHQGPDGRRSGQAGAAGAHALAHSAGPVHARGARRVQVGHHALPDAGLCPGRRDEPERVRGLRLRRLPCRRGPTRTPWPTGRGCRRSSKGWSTPWPDTTRSSCAARRWTCTCRSRAGPF